MTYLSEDYKKATEFYQYTLPINSYELHIYLCWKLYRKESFNYNKVRNNLQRIYLKTSYLDYAKAVDKLKRTNSFGKNCSGFGYFIPRNWNLSKNQFIVPTSNLVIENCASLIDVILAKSPSLGRIFTPFSDQLKVEVSKEIALLFYVNEVEVSRQVFDQFVTKSVEYLSGQSCQVGSWSDKFIEVDQTVGYSVYSHFENLFSNRKIIILG